MRHLSDETGALYVLELTTLRRDTAIYHLWSATNGYRGTVYQDLRAQDRWYIQTPTVEFDSPELAAQALLGRVSSGLELPVLDTVAS